MNQLVGEVALADLIRLKSCMKQHPFLVPSILILLASIPLVMGVVPRNRFYGIRTGKTLSDDAIWYPANRFGGWALIISSIISIAVSWMMPYDPIHFTTFLIPFAGFIVPLMIGVVLTLWYYRRLS
jgi:uncharacterized membrane protein